MPLLRRRGADEGVSWASAEDSSQGTGGISGLSALRQELRASTAALGPARALLSDRSSGFSGRLVTLGEMAADAACSPVGRLVTATAALTLAYFVI